MKYKRFEELPVWNAAIELALAAYRLTETGCLKGYTSLREQLERAALSVSNNIAEGFERGTHDELIAFLYVARGSAGEVRSMLALMERIPGLLEHRSTISGLRAQVDEIGRQLNAWLESLKAGPRLGPRSKTPATRQAAEQAARQHAFLDHLRRIQSECPSSNGPPPPPADRPQNE